MSLVQNIDYVAVGPPVVTAVAAAAVLVADLFLPARARAVLFGLTLAGTGGALAFVGYLVSRDDTRSTLCVAGGGCSYVVDDFTRFVQALVLIGFVVVVLLGALAVSDDHAPPGEYWFLLLSSVTGMLVLAAARDLVTLLLALEVVSLPAFVLVGLRRGDPRSSEAALKFFLFSVVATGLTVYGMALLYGVTGTVQLDRIGAALTQLHSTGGARSSVAAAAVVLVLVGFAFKVSAVPFHFWAPDTYEGAPVPVAAFLSTLSKVAGFTGLLVLLEDALRPYAATWGVVVAVIAAVTMTVGNVVALRQWHLVRLLAWSSIAQAGYVLVPLAIAASAAGRTDDGMRTAVQATLSYLAVYTAMNLGVFGCAVAALRRVPSGALDDLRGIGRRSPWLGAGFLVFLTALAGLPPGVAGLFAKVVVLRAAIDGGLTWLAVVAAVNTVIGLAYYVRVAAVVLAEPVPTDATDLPPSDAVAGRRTPVALAAALATAGAAVVALSVAPQPLLRVAASAGEALRRTVLP
jgi:NADH-quinone oxidoreductase subunit N